MCGSKLQECGQGLTRTIDRLGRQPCVQFGAGRVIVEHAYARFDRTGRDPLIDHPQAYNPVRSPESGLDIATARLSAERNVRTKFLVKQRSTCRECRFWV